MTQVITRFAPSPTGFLHIGGARTALFCSLYARHAGGKFLLRIEDTDKKRSSSEAIDAIIYGLNWLGLSPDEAPVFQSKQEARHAEVAHELLKKGAAYKCFATAEELAEGRAQAEKEGRVFKYDRRWRDKNESDAPAGAPYSIRFKAPLTGDVVVSDLVQGEVVVKAEDIDDLVILRADGSPTYMLAVVVDDHDMGITHVIRGDDHLTNTFKQKLIYEAMGWNVPNFAHIPLIHGADGAKLSKRHGALGVEAYRDLGYLPEAINNYLMHLGWSYNEQDIISIQEAAAHFDIKNVGKSPSRFDFDKLNFINSHYLRALPDDKLFELAKPFLEKKYSTANDEFFVRAKAAIKLTKERSQNLVDFADQSEIYFHRVVYTEKAKTMLEAGKEHISKLIPMFENVSNWQHDDIKAAFDEYAKISGLGLGKFMPAIRAGVCGTMESPSLIDVLEILGKDEVIKRLKSL
jgi:glutamyl-tRNA synthetase